MKIPTKGGWGPAIWEKIPKNIVFFYKPPTGGLHTQNVKTLLKGTIFYLQTSLTINCDKGGLQKKLSLLVEFWH